MSTETAVRYASECCDEYLTLYTLQKSSCDVSLTRTHLPWANSSVASATRAWVTIGGEHGLLGALVLSGHILYTLLVYITSYSRILTQLYTQIMHKFTAVLFSHILVMFWYAIFWRYLSLVVLGSGHAFALGFRLWCFELHCCCSYLVVWDIVVCYFNDRVIESIIVCIRYCTIIEHFGLWTL